jgi:hypothetical protein
MDILVQTQLNGVAVNGLTDDPEITIVRLDTDVVVVNGSVMSDVGVGGLYKFKFGNLAVIGVHYAFFVDADPNGNGQTDQRYYAGSFDFEIHDLWIDHGLNVFDPAMLFENVEGSDYDQTNSDGNGDGPDVDKSIVKVGATTTTTRQP